MKMKRLILSSVAAAGMLIALISFMPAQTLAFSNCTQRVGPWCLDTGQGACGNGLNMETGEVTRNGSHIAANASQYDASCSTTKFSCASGSVQNQETTEYENYDVYTWQCKAPLYTKNCSSSDYVPPPPYCGSAHQSVSENAPTENLCPSGVDASSVTLNNDGTKYTWTCTQQPQQIPVPSYCYDAPPSGTMWGSECDGGMTSGGQSACYATKQTTNQCGTPGRNSDGSPIASQLCGVGSSASGVTIENGNYSWTCTNGSEVASCQIPFISNGACGTSDGQTVTSAPTTNLCSAGNPGVVTRFGDNYYWSCQGTSGGTTAYCSAMQESAPGMCSYPDGATVSDLATSLTCINGTPSSPYLSGATKTVDGPTQDTYEWSCSGTGGMASTTCQTFIQEGEDAQCGPPHGQTVSTPNANTSCIVGTPTDGVLSDDDYLWLCENPGGATASCKATYNPPETVATCGDAHNTTYPNAVPPANPNLCLHGTSSAVTTLADKYTWSCSLAGTPTVQCQANRSSITDVCTPFNFSYTLDPKIVPTSLSTCNLTWTVTNNSPSEACPSNPITCKVDGVTRTSGINVNTGTHQIVCSDTKGYSKTESVSCRLLPRYGEF